MLQSRDVLEEKELLGARVTNVIHHNPNFDWPQQQNVMTIASESIRESECLAVKPSQRTAHQLQVTCDIEL